MAKCSVEACDRDAHKGGRGWCRAHYMRWYQTGDVRAHVPLRLHNVDPQLRFWPKVDKSGPVPPGRPELGPCWIYTGHTDRNGYGMFGLNGKQIGAHVFAFEVSGQTVPDGHELDHLCRNRSCVRASHLESVTHAENMRRAYADQTHCARGHLLSEDNLWRTRTGGRVCKRCSRRRVREFNERRESAQALPPCAVETCEKPARTRGWCAAHYRRWLLYGNPEASTGKAANGEWRGKPCQIQGCENPARAKGWCNRHYAKWYEHGDPMAPDKQSSPGTTIQERIENRVRRDGECWIWLGKLQPNGYGRLNVKGAGQPVHRVAYETYVGPIPDGFQVDQKCGKRSCVSPKHLLAVKRITIAVRP